MSSRVEISESKEQLHIKINALRSPFKTFLLGLWLALFAVCGIVAVMQLVAARGGENRIFWVVFLSFWLYFMWSVGKAFTWRLKGYEELVFSKEGLSLVKKIFGNEKPKQYELSAIAKFQKASLEENKLFSVYENAYWFIGGETISFTCNGKEIRLGTQLEGKEHSDVLKKLKFFQQHFVKA